MNINFKKDEKIWSTLKNLIIDKQIQAAPLKNMVYAFGTQTELHEAFKDRINGDIKRTPVNLMEIKKGSTFRGLYLKTILKALCQLFNLETDGYDKLWRYADKKSMKIGDIYYELFDAIKLSLFFDDKFAYLSIRPTFYLKNEISKEIIIEIGRKYNYELFGNQPNVKFEKQIEKWKGIFFSNKERLHFEYPLNSGIGFRFSISADTMHVRMMKSGNRQWQLRIPADFNQKTILHSGIQYLEPQLEFTSKYSGQITRDFHPMRGLCNNRPYDFFLNGNVFDPEINLAVICPSGHSEKIYSFLNRLNRAQTAGGFNPDYLIDYPGFYSAYGTPLNIPVKQSDLWKDYSFEEQFGNLMQYALSLARLITNKIDQLELLNKKLVIVIYIPSIFNTFTRVEQDQEFFDLHDYIKAYAAQKQMATQFIQEETLSDYLVCQINWWLSLSFYVKAQRTPWILNGLDSDTAFVGIGYSIDRRKENDKIVMGCSHIYNSTGQGLKYRLSRINDCYFDRQNNPYLSYEDAYKFGVLIRELFFKSMGEIPKRVVVHKRTHFKTQEINGITDSFRKTGVEQVDLIEINYEENARFVSMMIRDNMVIPHPFPLSRGSCFLLDNTTALLWTHGIVPSVRAETLNYFQGGKNIPVPLKIKKHYGSSNIGLLATEILGLTKMNWNSFDMYSKLPATIQTSNEIARIGWLLSRFEGKTYDYRNFM